MLICLILITVAKIIFSGVDLINSLKKQLKHISGVTHETFAADPGSQTEIWVLGLSLV